MTLNSLRYLRVLSGLCGELLRPLYPSKNRSRSCLKIPTCAPKAQAEGSQTCNVWKSAEKNSALKMRSELSARTLRRGNAYFI